MNKAILLCASIGWQTIYDENGRPKARHIGVSVSWMPYEISYKRCGFNHHISCEYADLMRREPQRIKMMVDHITRCFATAAAKLMEQHHAEPSDMSEACEELRRGLRDGFRSFLENDRIWIHHFNQVLNVPKGSRYRAEDGEWYEAEEDAMIVVRCGAGEQMMTQAEYERIKQKGTMKYDEIEKKVQSYRWLESIAKEYRAMIDRINAEQDYFRVEKIAYTARGDIQYLDLNCHRTIPGHYIADGLKEALIGIDEEIKQIKEELKAINIEL